MSLSSNSRKESTESYAAQRMGNTMGVAPEQSQLAKTDRPGTLLPSESYQSGDIESEDVEPIDTQSNGVKNDASGGGEVSDETLARDTEDAVGHS